MTLLDPRLAQRRRAVAEHQARRRVRRLVTLLVVVVLAAAIGWLLQSPLLSVHRITVEGAHRAPVRQLLRKNGAGPLTPLVAIRPTRVEQALEADPWVAAAHVTVRFPDTIEVTVRERNPVGWARHEGKWLLVAADGVPVESVPSPSPAPPG